MINKGERTFVVVLIIFSAIALWQAFQIAGFSKWASPGVFPMLASATMLVSALFIILDHYNQSRKPEQQTGSTDKTDYASLDVMQTLPTRVAVVTALLLLYIIAMPTLGFLLGSGLFLFASISYLWNKPVWLSLVISILSLTIIHLVFRLAFQVILPEGTLIASFS